MQKKKNHESYRMYIKNVLISFIILINNILYNRPIDQLWPVCGADGHINQ